MVIDDFEVHPKFKLNGVSYSKSGLKALGYDLIKEGSAFEKSIGEFLSDWLDEEPNIEVKTSGSTGKPKNIFLQKLQMVNSARATGEYFNLKAENSALLCLSVDYIAGKMMLVRAMVLGLELDYVEPTSTPLTGLAKTYDFGAMVPLQLQNSLEEIEKVKTLIVGGAAISSSLKEQVQKMSTDIYETYGMTETITHIAVKKVNHSSVNAHAVENSFKAIPNVLFSKDDRNCLVISAPRISEFPVITNDIVSIISETEFVWLGRFDNIINSGGIKLVPELIEAKLAEYIPNRFFVAGLEDEVLGQKLILVIEGTSYSVSILEKIQENKALERFETPKTVFYMPQFVTTNNGKIRRKETLKLLDS